MTKDWFPVFVLPNVSLAEEIGCEMAVLAPADDDRVRALKRQHGNFRRFLNRFSDNFGEKFEPAVLLLNRASSEKLRGIDALAGFRDVIALAAVTRGRALALRFPRISDFITYGEFFLIYPWMLDRHYEDIIGRTPALLGIHELSRFKGQSSPTVFRAALNHSKYDTTLCNHLLTCWQRWVESTEPAWVDVALFRSLNMAYHASLLPAGTEVTLYDYGRSAALWVSALEILVHPGVGGYVSHDKVFNLIEKTNWATSELAAKTYSTGRGKTEANRTLASFLCEQLYKCRNAFLHGNPVDRDTLIVEASERPLSDYAGPLYRIALTAFLDLTHSEVPPTDDPVTMVRQISAKRNFIAPQEDAERALLTAIAKPDCGT